MSIVIIKQDALLGMAKFQFKCLKCGSENVQLEIDWAAYPFASWSTTTIICNNCHEEEILHEQS